MQKKPKTKQTLKNEAALGGSLKYTLSLSYSSCLNQLFRLYNRTKLIL